MEIFSVKSGGTLLGTLDADQAACEPSIEAIVNLPLDVSMTTFDNLLRILNALSNTDALAIFLYAKDGISNSKETIHKLRMTQKRFYTRLSSLVDVNLIEKTRGGYRYTTLGKVFSNMGNKLVPVLENKARLTVMDRIGQIDALSPQEAYKIAEVLSIEELIGDVINEIKVVDSFEKAVTNAINLINKSENSIYFASKYVDIKVSEACMKSLKRGVMSYFLVDNQDQFSNAVQILKSVIRNPSYIKMMFQYLKGSKLLCRYTNLPYTFMIIDKKYAMLEVPKPFTNTFSLSFFFNNELLCNKLLDNFNILWDNAAEIKGT
jgi:hypothetical protein